MMILHKIFQELLAAKMLDMEKKQSNCIENVENEKIADGSDGPQVSLHAGVPGASGIAFHVEGVSFERDDQQGGHQHRHDQRDEDPQVKGVTKLPMLVSEKYTFSVELEEGMGTELFTYTLNIPLEKGKLEQKEKNKDSLTSPGISHMTFLFITENHG